MTELEAARARCNRIIAWVVRHWDCTHCAGWFGKDCRHCGNTKMHPDLIAILDREGISVEEAQKIEREDRNA